jgi:hypothetical protein
MALFPLGILSAAGAGGVAGSYELIESTILGSATSSVTFSSLGDYSSTYKHLQIRVAARDTRSGSVGGALIRFNSDTGSNYATHNLYGNGSSVVSDASTSQSYIVGLLFPSGNIAANIFGGGAMDILDAYSTTKNKTTRALSGFATNTINLTSGLWMSTASITSITILPSGGNLLAGSRFSLYGIR